MADLLGPSSSCPGVTTARPTESRVFGASDTWLAPCTSPAANDGTMLQSVLFNSWLANLRAIVRGFLPVGEQTNTDDVIFRSIKRGLTASLRREAWETPGTYSWTVPDGVTSLECVEAVGGGGAGGSSGDGSGGGVAGNVGAGGSAATWRRGFGMAVTPGSVLTIVVGAKGVGVATSANGGDGGDSSISGMTDGTLTAPAGRGGPSGVNTLSAPAQSGVGAGGVDVMRGRLGGSSGPNSLTYSASNNLVIPGRGGVAAGGLSLPSWGQTGGDGYGFGTGGDGASGGSLVKGGDGAPGRVMILYRT